MNIYEIPLYYISFKKKKDLEDHFKERGFKNINHFESIDSRKFDIKKSREDNLISIRSYNDLINGRDQHCGISTVGCIGCTLSHLNLWKKCVKDNLDYIIIAEDDVIINRNFTKKDIKNIMNFLKKPKSIFLTASISYNKNIKIMFGLHFYIISKEACKELIKDALPIDVQTDHYITHKADLNHIIIKSDNSLAVQKQRKSSVQGGTCIKCHLPDRIWIYILIIIIIILTIICLIIFIKYYYKCRNNLGICEIKNKKCNIV